MKASLLLSLFLLPLIVPSWAADTKTNTIVSAAVTTTTNSNLTEAAKKDLAQLQGKWQMVSGSADGTDLPGGMMKNSYRLCDQDQTTVVLAGQLMMRAKFSLNPSTKPKAIDYQVTTGLNAGKTQLGIYSLDGDTIRFCFSAPGQPRPTDFTTKIGDTRASSVWKKEKPEKKP